MKRQKENKIHLESPAVVLNFTIHHIATHIIADHVACAIRPLAGGVLGTLGL